MNVKFLDLTRQYEVIRNRIEPEILKCMQSGQYIGGAAVSEFEKKFARLCGVKHAIALNSGTDALVIAFKALGIGEGDEVITTPFTFFATAETIAMVGATPVFADVDAVTYNLDPADVEKRITKKTKAIVPVHIFGQPVDMDALRDIAKRHNLFIIEDACQAVGASYKGEMAGSMGDMGCFSFFPTKNLGAFGDAGMITTNDDNLDTVCRAYREHGAAQNGAKARCILDGAGDELAGTVSVDGLYNPYKYYNYLIAYNSRMDAMQATVLNIKADYLSTFNARRAEIAAYYHEQLKGVGDIIVPEVAQDVCSVWHQYAILTEKKNELGEYLAAKGIGSAAFYPVPLHLQKALLYLGYKEGDLPVAEMLTRKTVCLPIFPELTQEELECVVEGIRSFYV